MQLRQPPLLALAANEQVQVQSALVFLEDGRGQVGVEEVSKWSRQELFGCYVARSAACLTTQTVVSTEK